jgi:hypothetical protein
VLAQNRLEFGLKCGQRFQPRGCVEQARGTTWKLRDIPKLVRFSIRDCAAPLVRVSSVWESNSFEDLLAAQPSSSLGMVKPELACRPAAFVQRHDPSTNIGLAARQLHAGSVESHALSHAPLRQ